MAKPDPALLDASRYPFHHQIVPRFADLDLNRHINNVTMAAYIEDARVRFYEASGYRKHLTGLSTMVVSLNLEYLNQTHYPDPVTIACAVERVGRTSMTMIHVVTQNEVPVVFSRCVTVAVDASGQTVAIPELLNEWTLRP
ncbi:acyl-CoA thioesterase [Novosphingobium sp. MBES04]|uniref:acyl-CoA thioesterase n=1 Tax=Novosphingobium sp. MBES04 TaxID=1206458 RepID=UPI000694A058|nr:acyl-CoA thioesterase [Novosphingobium sp. MBES04]GAM04575.1 thioesterase [Novosphingobium sp. MBES04]